MEEVIIGDLYALSAIRTAGIEPTRTAGDGRRATWVFIDTPQLREVLEQFYGRRMAVDALGYSEQVRSAKAEAMSLSRAS